MSSNKNYFHGIDFSSKYDKTIVICNLHRENVTLTKDFVETMIGKPFLSEYGVTIGHIISTELVDEHNVKCGVEMNEHFEAKI